MRLTPLITLPAFRSRLLRPPATQTAGKARCGFLRAKRLYHAGAKWAGAKWAGAKWAALFLFAGLSISTFAQAPREVDLGASFAVEVEKELNRFLSVTGEEEVRLISNRIGFDRNVASLGVDYSLFDRKVKVGAYYAFLRLYNNDYLFESRHRYYVNISYRETFEPFTLSWRGRLQSTCRNENRDEYKVNPKYVLKNRAEVAYAIWGSPWRPYFSCEFSTTLHDPVRGRELTRIRFQGGASWRLNRTTYLDFFLRFDEHLIYSDPQVVWLGVAYKVRFPNS